MKNPLLDKEFLLKLDEAREREIYVRLIALTIDEHPVETIEGRTTQGNLNIDGKSAVRRTCTLSLVANEMNINEFYWGMNSKFKLQIGIENKIDNSYPEIIWFPFGTYLITNFTISQNVNSYTVSITGKDKMCMLNGEIGGAITSLSVDFGKYEETNEKGERVIKSYPIKDIIREGVHQYGNEPFHNIIINDLDELGIILKEYRGDVPLYLFRHKDSDEFLNMTLDDKVVITVNGIEKTLSQLIQTEEYRPDDVVYPDGTIPFNFDLRNSFTGVDYQPTLVTIGKENYYIAKVEYGDTPGYTLTDLVYSGDLIAAVGDSFTSVLDKIVNMLGSFEYFYDIDGRFVFQKKKTYVSTSWNNLQFDNTTGEYYGENAALTSDTVYSFEDSKLVQAFSNSPDLMNLRNDFSVWGTRKSATGKELPVHMRYAIDKKPYIYIQFPITEEEAETYNKIYGTNLKPRSEEECRTYVTNNFTKDPYFEEVFKDVILDVLIEKEGELYNIYIGENENRQKIQIRQRPIICDWREIIYQMAIDFRMYNHIDGFEAKIAQSNPNIYPTGKTGYEQYYIDMEGFWRQLYNPDYEPEYSVTSFIEDINKTRYVKGYIPIAQEDNDYEDYYLILEDKEEDRNYLVKYIDTVLFKDENNEHQIYYVEKSEKDEDGIETITYVPLINNFDLSKYVLYLKNGEEYTRYIDKETLEDKFEKIFIKKSEKNYLPVLDYFKINNLTNEEELKKEWLDYFIFKEDNQGIYNKVFLYKKEAVEKEDGVVEYTITQLKTIEEIKKCEMDCLFYQEADSVNKDEFLSAVKIDFFIRKERDINNQILYKKNNDEYILYNNNIEPKIKQNNIYVIVKEIKDPDGKIIEREFRKVSELINANREKLFLKINDNYISLLELLKSSDKEENIVLYKENKEEDVYHNIEFYSDEMKKLYINNGKYQRYIYSPCYTFLGEETDYRLKEEKSLINYYEQYSDYNMDISDEQNLYWNYAVQNEPETLNFWIDFLDLEGELEQFSVPAVGNRPKAINDSSVKAIYFRDVPNVLFVDSIPDNIHKKSGYNYIQLQKGMRGLFVTSAQGKSAKNVVEENLYKHGYCTESVSATVIPIYYLEPNTRIFIRDDNSKINGEYILNSMSIPLTYNGMMNISANKAVERILY